MSHRQKIDYDVILRVSLSSNVVNKLLAYVLKSSKVKESRFWPHQILLNLGAKLLPSFAIFDHDAERLAEEVWTTRPVIKIRAPNLEYRIVIYYRAEFKGDGA